MAAAPSQPVVESFDSAAADTLRLEVRSGEALIYNLPREERGQTVRYSIIHAPALSMVVENSFVWATLVGEVGWQAILLERDVAGRRDTLVMRVDVRPPDFFRDGDF